MAGEDGPLKIKASTPKRIMVSIWDYVKANIVDTENGEWWWSRLPDGTINRREDKAGFWKCPYHNSRMCLETLRQLPNIKIHHAHHAITS